MLIIDTSDLSFERVSLKKEDSCRVCSRKPEEIIFQSKREEKGVKAVCGRAIKSTYIVVPEKDLNLDFQKIIENMDESYKIVTMSELGIALKKDAKVDINILKSGVGIIKGTRGDEVAQEIYEQLTQQ